jgi:hypothetical protein
MSARPDRKKADAGMIIMRPKFSIVFLTPSLAVLFAVCLTLFTGLGFSAPAAAISVPLVFQGAWAKGHPIFGPTQASVYWSSSISECDFIYSTAWTVFFSNGYVDFGYVVTNTVYARAVRTARLLLDVG